VAARSIILVTVLTGMFLTGSTGLTSVGIEETGGTSSSFLYTVAPHYEPLAWMRGAERFPSGASVFLHDSTARHPLFLDFAQSADPAVSFDGQRVLFAGRLKAQDPWQIWEVPLAGGEPRRITSGAEDCIRPFYLPDNRIAYARKNAGRFVIEALDITGGKPLPLTYGPANYLPTDVLRDGRILFEAGYPLGSETTPEIYTVYSDGSGVESYRCDHGKARHQGKQINSGDVVFTSGAGLARFTSARAQGVPISTPAGEYAGDVAETPSGDWLLPWRRNAQVHFQLMLWSPGAAQLRPAVAEPDSDVVQPVLLGERALPKKHPTGLHDWPNANLLCLNAYTSKYSFPGGSIHSARLYTRDDAGHPRLLGAAPVERDGSFFVHVPSDQPLQIELLDSAGKTLQREAGFFWMRRGEQRVCVGCHAGPETAPENAVPMILLRSTTPADMTGGDSNKAGGGN
jgi:hydrazine synthase alpha subunit-like protein